MAGPDPVFHPAAVREARAARSWYAERSGVAAVAFMAELDRAVKEISAFPDRWPRSLHGTRRFLMRRFPFSVVYRCRGDVIDVVAVAHARRKPGYWARR